VLVSPKPRVLAVFSVGSGSKISSLGGRHAVLLTSSSRGKVLGRRSEMLCWHHCHHLIHLSCLYHHHNHHNLLYLLLFSSSASLLAFFLFSFFTSYYCSVPPAAASVSYVFLLLPILFIPLLFLHFFIFLFVSSFLFPYFSYQCLLRLGQ
jgi:hypothetical protein